MANPIGYNRVRGQKSTHELLITSEIFYPSLVLVQPRKTRPCLTERLLMGRKESNQIKRVKSKKEELFFPSPHPVG